LAIIWQKYMDRPSIEKKSNILPANVFKQQNWMVIIIVFFIFSLMFPNFVSAYQINIVTTALIYVVLGLGLNIVVGLAGLLDLGYVAFYAVGAYSYALINYHFQISFWILLPFCALLSAAFGVVLGFPVLRLRGDYLAIVTLGFGEIIRLVMENWNEFSFGPSGIANIPRPPFFGMDQNIIGPFDLCSNIEQLIKAMNNCQSG
jgi:branched-chain amino acid transport system permease protein